MGGGRTKSPAIAGILSGLMPGLGQFYCGHWAKGGGFVLAAIVVDAGFGVSSGMLEVLRSVGGPAPAVGFGKVLLGSLVLLGVALWSILDAVRTARRS